MARTRTISDEQILDAAREVFLEQGLSGTTAEIAKRAGISEGSIFRRFDTKDDLFMKAMGLPEEPPFLSTLQRLVGKGDLLENLFAICTEILEHMTDLIPKTVMLMSCHITPREVFSKQKEPSPVQAIRGLAAFFEAEHRAGRIGRCEPATIARMLLGSLHFYAFTTLSGINEHIPQDPEDYVRGIIDTLWEGIAPDE